MASNPMPGSLSFDESSRSIQADNGKSVVESRAAIAVRLACTGCRSRHLKCDGTSPCSRCRAENIGCTYTPSRRGYKGLRRTSRVGNSTILQGTQASSAAGGISGSNPSPASNVNSASITGSLSPPSLTSPPGNGFNFNTPDDRQGVAQVRSVQSGAVFDGSDAGLIHAFYTLFHPAHPFVLPKHCLGAFSSVHVHSLDLAMRYIGSLYVPAAKTSDYQMALLQVLERDDKPDEGFKVQILLLAAIGLHMSDLEEESANVMRKAVQLALELGMNNKEYAIFNGNTAPVLEESWKRTWWEVFVLDGMFSGVNPNHYQLQLAGVKCSTLLPCEEQDFISGKIPPTFKTLEDLDDAIFEDEEKVTFTSGTYRIDAIRLLHKVGQVQHLLNTTGRVDEQLINDADLHLTNWWLHLPQSKKLSVNKHGKTDEILFEAHMIASACQVLLHRPRSDLRSDETSEVSTCISAHQPSLPSVGQDYHTAKALQAAKDISSLIVLPSPLIQHTPFFSCSIVMASVVFLSYWSFILNSDGDSQIKSHIKLNIGVLKTQAKCWPIAKTILGQVRGVAQEIFQSRKAILNNYTGGVTRELAFQGLVEESSQQLDTQAFKASYLALDMPCLDAFSPGMSASWASNLG